QSRCAERNRSLSNPRHVGGILGAPEHSRGQHWPPVKSFQEIPMKRPLLRSLALVTALTLTAFSTALAGPPWLAIEYPANPFDRASRDGFLTVRTYHHGEIVAKTVTGTAEGVVNGKRQSVRLDIRPGSQTGTYVVFWQQ